MEVTRAQIRKVNRLLADSDFDLAAGIREDTINDFFKSHFKTQTQQSDNVYTGGARSEDLKLDYRYTVLQPLEIDLLPLSQGAFSKVFRGWLKTVPEVSRIADLDDPSLPLPVPFSNVRVVAPEMSLWVKADSVENPINLTFRMRLFGFVQVIQLLGRTVVRIIPISVRLEDPKDVAKQIDAELAKSGIKPKPGKDEDPDCVALRQVIFHIINEVLGFKIGSFVKDFELPVPIRLFDNVSIVSAGANIVDNLVVILAKISATSMSGSSVRLSDLIRSADGARGINQHLTEQLKRIHANGRAARNASLDSIRTFPDKGIFLLLHERFFQLIADKYLAFSDSGEGSGGWGPFFYAYGWSLSLSNPKVQIRRNAVRVSAQLNGGGWAEGGIHTHCGDISHRIGARLTAEIVVDLRLQFRNNDRELWMVASLRDLDDKWQFDGFPPIVGEVFAFLFDVFTDIAEAFVKLAGIRLERRLVTLPKYFPGTQLEYKADLGNPVLDPATGALLTAGKIDFKP